MLTPRERYARFIHGDGVDWPHLYAHGQIDESTLYEKTGLTARDIVTVVVPVPQAASFGPGGH